jgi:L-rhamnose mutarotase
LVIKQHLDKQYTIAIPLLKQNHTNYLVLDYKGDEHKRFVPLVKHLFNSMKISNYNIYQGRDEKRVRVFVSVNNMPLKEAEVKLQEISDNLSQKLSKKWKCLPLSSLPNEYNIVTLPYKELS